MVSYYYKTSDIAKEVGVHPNTVRLYEKWGLLQNVPRGKNGYRLYERRHLEQMRLARIAFRCEYVEGKIRESATGIVKMAAGGDLEKALDMAYSHLQHVRSEKLKAEESMEIIKFWLKGKIYEDDAIYMKRSDVARLMGVSIDVLRNWERNGLINIPRNDNNNYRIYGPKEIARLKVIRTLRAANYSMMSILRMMSYIDSGNSSDYEYVLNNPYPDEDIVSAADRWIGALDETQGDAQNLISQIMKMMKMNI